MQKQTTEIPSTDPVANALDLIDPDGDPSGNGITTLDNFEEALIGAHEAFRKQTHKSETNHEGYTLIVNSALS